MSHATGKIVIAGNKLWISQYSKGFDYEFVRDRSEDDPLVLLKETKEKKFNPFAGRRASQIFERKILENFAFLPQYPAKSAEGRSIKFLTLTFAENKMNIEEANEEFHLFIKRFRYEYNFLSYACVPERQKRGALHYHMLLYSDFINKEWLFEEWNKERGQGGVKIEKVEGFIEDVGSYMSKYMRKDFDNEDRQDIFKKRFFTSRDVKSTGVEINLKEDFDSDVLKRFSKYVTQKGSFSYENEWIGEGKTDVFLYWNNPDMRGKMKSLEQEIEASIFLQELRREEAK